MGIGRFVPSREIDALRAVADETAVSPLHRRRAWPGSYSRSPHAENAIMATRVPGATIKYRQQRPSLENAPPRRR